MTTLNLDESHDFDSEKYLLATQVVDLMTKQFNSKELSDVFPYFQTGGDEEDVIGSVPDPTPVSDTKSQTQTQIQQESQTQTESQTQPANKTADTTAPSA